MSLIFRSITRWVVEMDLPVVAIREWIVEETWDVSYCFRVGMRLYQRCWGTSVIDASGEVDVALLKEQFVHKAGGRTRSM